MKKLLLAPGILIFFGFFTLNASAFVIEQVKVDEVNDFVIQPAKMEIFADPGETVTKSVTITNRSAETVNFRLELEDFVGSEDGSVAVKLLGNDTSPYSFKSIIKPEINEFSLKFGERITIPLTIAIPAGQAPGGYYTSVIVSNAPSKEGGVSAGARTISRVAELIFIRVNGEVLEEGALRDFRMSPPAKFYKSGPYKFEFLFENTGNVHLTPYGEINIRNIFGTIVAKVPVDAYYSLPHSQRYREVTFDKSGMFGWYKAELELHRGYKDGEDAVDGITLSFFVIPLDYVLAVAGIIIILFLITSYIRRNFEFKRKS
jgi:hypothetical protein